MRPSRILDALDGLGDWRFVTCLWLARWPIVVPMDWVLSRFVQGYELPAIEAQDLAVVVAGAVVLSPLIETLVECALVYQVFKWLVWRDRRRPARSWPFMVMSALAMVLLHPLNAGPFAFTTGMFLAYCYGHFAAGSRLRAYVFTSLYHAGINTVGVTLISLGIIS